ncbi:Regulator of RpoS [subsurface metagenome]
MLSHKKKRYGKKNLFIFNLSFICMLRQDKINKFMGENTDSKILVIDDSMTNNLLLEAVLKREGYHVFTAFSAEEALNQLYKDIPDLILLDILMPIVDGFEFLKIIKSKDDLNDIPVIVISAVKIPENLEKVKELGVEEFIPKPIDINALLTLISIII